MWSYFRERPVIITYGLLALSFILVIALFATVHSNKPKLESKELSTKDDIRSVNITVNLLLEKMSEVEKTAKKRGICETGWQLFEGHCYFFTNTKESSWNRARSTCIGKSADLVVITTENEQKFISKISGNMPYWIGLNDIEEENKWTWVDGTPYESSYKAWMTDKPTNSEKADDCAHTWMEGKWNDKNCNDRNNFAICEKKL
ncbi:hepatic lectin-like isoform X2 [Eleutherodactylus coqui]